jgi:hypothetical protein
MFFYDPRNLGGFEPIGQLLKRSYYIFTAVLLLWFLQTHAPVILSEVHVSPYPPPGPIIQVAITAVWFGGVLTIAYSMFRMHSLMKAKKEATLRKLEAEMKTAVENPYDVKLFDVEDREKYEEIQESLARPRDEDVSDDGRDVVPDHHQRAPPPGAKHGRATAGLKPRPARRVDQSRATLFASAITL